MWNADPPSSSVTRDAHTKLKGHVMRGLDHDSASHIDVPRNSHVGLNVTRSRPLVFVRGSMNTEAYCTILDNEMLPRLWRFYGMDPCYFQDDNTRCHVSRATMQWYADNNVRRLDWPSHSPDFNPIEHLWDELDHRTPAQPVTECAYIKDAATSFHFSVFSYSEVALDTLNLVGKIGFGCVGDTAVCFARRTDLTLPSAAPHTRIISVYSANVYSTMLIGETKAREWGSRQGRRRVPSGGCGEAAARALTSHQVKPSSVSGGVAPGLSHLRIVLDDPAGRPFISGISCFPRFCTRAVIHFTLATYKMLATPREEFTQKRCSRRESGEVVAEMFEGQGQQGRHHSVSQWCVRRRIYHPCQQSDAPPPRQRLSLRHFRLAREPIFRPSTYERRKKTRKNPVDRNSHGLGAHQKVDFPTPLTTGYVGPPSEIPGGSLTPPMVRLLAYQLGEPIPGRVASRFSNVRIVPDDATASRWIFSWISRFPRSFIPSGAAPYSPRFTFIGSRDPDVKSCPNLSTTLTLNPFHYIATIGGMTDSSKPTAAYDVSAPSWDWSAAITWQLGDWLDVIGHAYAYIISRKKKGETAEKPSLTTTAVKDTLSRLASAASHLSLILHLRCLFGHSRANVSYDSAINYFGIGICSVIDFFERYSYSRISINLFGAAIDAFKYDVDSAIDFFGWVTYHNVAIEDFLKASLVGEETSINLKASVSMPRRRQRVPYQHVSEFERVTMIGLRETGLSYRDISDRTGHGATTMMRVWNQWSYKATSGYWNPQCDHSMV
ncbi:hypothetical protein PR048_014778 [Dryococelus australis]|uniref:Tc1-like transposase DDE domain-containing protein n=1 Tax=Dryococelus australis TaxID=614101 RepID=A0ABQ9HF96_9NEOP|nr:hypothetical protein PR048_014778 [Dryococelus australis]